MENFTVKWKKTSPVAQVPKKATEGSIGYDLNSVEDVEIPPMGIRLVSTGLSVLFPKGFELQIRSRSGLASKGVFVVNSPGTIDQDYTGTIKVILCNLRSEAFNVRTGDRIAQACFAMVPSLLFEEVEEIQDTARGSGGFGSTGV